MTGPRPDYMEGYDTFATPRQLDIIQALSLIHISEPTRPY